MRASFRELIVWQRAMEMSVAIYRLTSTFPESERFGITNQMRRASVSVASNIAEGYGRLSRGEYLQFLGHARGSIFEMQTQIALSQALGYGEGQKRIEADILASEVGKMLNAMIRRLPNAQTSGIQRA